MFLWKKLGKVFAPQDVSGRPWMKEFAQAPSAIIFEEYVRIYFSCRPKPSSQGEYISYSAWVDLDRTDLSKVLRVAERPVLSLGGLGEFDEFGTYPISVIRVQNEIIAYYAGWTRCESVPFNVAIGSAISKDNGNTFEKLGVGPIIGYSPEEPFILSGPKIRRFDGAWQLFYIAGRKWKIVNNRPEPVYKIRMATSQDGIHWEKLNRDLIPSRIEEDEAQASPDVFYANGKYHMFFCYRYSGGFRSKEKGYRIGYASSTDLIRWDRDDSKAGIDVSDDGWDSEMIMYSK
jgi:sucrose-6-phosphate hydrolase SacC (GH32 family)